MSTQACVLDETEVLWALRITVSQSTPPASHVHDAAVANAGDVPLKRSSDLNCVRLLVTHVSLCLLLSLFTNV